VQGFLIDGCERFPFGLMTLVSFADRAGLGECLKRFLPHSAFSATDDVALSVALSSRGVAKLGLPEATLNGFESAFREGVAEPIRSARLGDVGENDPRRWQWGGTADATGDVLYLLHATTEAALSRAEQALDRELSRVLASRIYSLTTTSLPSRKEHFGFRGGIAQPNLDSDQPDARRPGILRRGPRHNTIAPGEIVLGYTNEFGAVPPSPLVERSLDTQSDLPDAAPSSGRQWRDLGRNGSYLVVRQLDQDVYAFWRAIDALSSSAEERERFAAKLVGRWRSGAPLVLSPHRDRPELADADDFGYADTDPRGERCPFGAHVRRANPRDWRLANWGPVATRMSNQHRIVRRSRPYGPPVAESMEPADILRVAEDGKQRGLLFMAFNVDIARQFELIQEAWFNNPHFGRLRGEVDPLVGRAELQGPFTMQGDPVSKRFQGLKNCIRLKGSGYFFFPSIPAVRFLADWATSRPRETSAWTHPR
jgi:Dyp-type peroxidase family